MIPQLRLDDPESARGLEDVAQYLKKARRVVFITGAGVSCNAGIPDFRSEDGLYNIVKRQYPEAVVKGKDLFDSILFRDPLTVQIFHTFMAGLRKSILDAHPTPTHHLIKRLREKKKLLRCYTQNIDGLEKQVGLSLGYTEPQSLEVVQLHGDIHLLKCPNCMIERDWTKEDEELLASGKAPICSECLHAENARAACGKRSRPVGLLRPNIVLYGEEHPYGDIIGKCLAKDIKSAPDLLIIAGTSLKVVGIRHLVKDLAKAVQNKGGKVLFVNRTPVSGSMWKGTIDYHLECDTDAWVSDLKERIPLFFMNQSKIKVKQEKRLLDPQTPEKPPKKQALANYYPVSPKIEPDLLDSSPQGFKVFQVNPQRAAPIDYDLMAKEILRSPSPTFSLDIK